MSRSDVSLITLVSATKISSSRLCSLVRRFGVRSRMIRTFTLGYVLLNRATAFPSNDSAGKGPLPMTSSPASMLCSRCKSRSSSCISCKTGFPLCRRCSPNTVVTTSRFDRSKSFIPSCFSRDARERLRAGCEIWSSWAALAKLPRLARI